MAWPRRPRNSSAPFRSPAATGVLAGCWAAARRGANRPIGGKPHLNWEGGKPTQMGGGANLPIGGANLSKLGGGRTLPKSGANPSTVEIQPNSGGSKKTQGKEVEMIIKRCEDTSYGWLRFPLIPTGKPAFASSEPRCPASPGATGRAPQCQTGNPQNTGTRRLRLRA